MVSDEEACYMSVFVSCPFLAVPIGLQGVSVVTDARGYSNLARGQQNT